MRLRNMYTITTLDGSRSVKLPNPDQVDNPNLIATLVNSGRNANAVITAQKIGRDQDKSTMGWNYLEKDDWEELVKFLHENFFFMFTYYSPVFGQKITRKCYVSDRNWKAFAIDLDGNPTAYESCSLSFVDTGEGD